jgi:uncharacterized protein involved in exopolysaccharide biosynthesis
MEAKIDLSDAVRRRLHDLTDRYARRSAGNGPAKCAPGKKELADLERVIAEIAQREGAEVAAQVAAIKQRPRVIFDSLAQAQNYAAGTGQLFGELLEAYPCPRSKHGHAHVRAVKQ